MSSNIDASTWDVTGTINDAAWNDGTTNWAQYSLLFLGATITSEGSNWKHVYQFLYSAIDHRVTWRPYKDDPTVIANQMRRTYAAEETARVYDTGNFDLLDI